MKLGGIQLETFEGLRRMPQKAASAWTGATVDLVGAGYKPLIYLGYQIVKGVNYYFIAEQTMMTANMDRRIIKMAINEFGTNYKILGDSIEVIAE